MVNNFNSSIKNNESKQLYDRLFYTEKLIQLLHTNDNEIDTLKDHERDIITATEEEWLDYLLSEKRKCRSLRDIMITRAKYYEELREMISGECGLPDHAEIFFNEKEEKKEKNKKKYNADQYELNIPIKPSEFIIYEMFFKINNCIINYEKNVLIGYRRSFQGLINQLQKGSA